MKILILLFLTTISIFLDISNGYNSTTQQYDRPVTSINGTLYDDIINKIILNNSSTINFNKLFF